MLSRLGVLFAFILLTLGACASNGSPLDTPAASSDDGQTDAASAYLAAAGKANAADDRTFSDTNEGSSVEELSAAYREAADTNREFLDELNEIEFSDEAEPIAARLGILIEEDIALLTAAAEEESFEELNEAFGEVLENGEQYNEVANELRELLGLPPIDNDEVGP